MKDSKSYFGPNGSCDVTLPSANNHAFWRVQYVYDWIAVVGRDFDRRVLLGGCGSADEKGDVQPNSLHLFGDVHHLREGGGDQARQTDHVSTFGQGWFVSNVCSQLKGTFFVILFKLI